MNDRSDFLLQEHPNRHLNSMRIDFLALYAIPLVVLFGFATLRPRTAIIWAFIGAWLFLPQSGIEISGLPNYTKVTATSGSVLLGLLLFDPGRLFGLRPRWYDLPMALVCLVPLASSLSNGLGLYDGASASATAIATWGVPYLIGRACLTDLEGLRELTLGLVVGGLLYVPLCLFEIRFSPQLHTMVYGYHQHSFAQTIRFGGYRPTVFLPHGLAVGLWMGGATVAGYWLWASGALKRIWGQPFGIILLVLAATAVLCKSIGALVLAALGLAVWPILGRLALARIVLLALLLISPLFITTRIVGLWSGEEFVNLSRSAFGDERAQSLEFRIQHEEKLVSKAIERPILGWGGWGRSRIYDEQGWDISVTDSLWIIKLGTEGLAGMTAIMATLLLPLILLWRRCPLKTWRRPEVAPAAVLAILIALYMVDCLFNAMLNPIYLLAAGGLMGLNVRRTGQSDAEPLLILGRDLKNQGRPLEAASAWRQALDLWDIEPPHDDAGRRDQANTFNDLAWLLAIDPDSPAHDPAEAVRLARKAIAEDPTCGTYQNTLGMALYRIGDPKAAIAVLQHSVELSGGNAFDHLLLSLAHSRLGNATAAADHLRHAEDPNFRLCECVSDMSILRREIIKGTSSGRNHEAGS